MVNPLLTRTAVRAIPLDLARPFIERWHYTYSIPTGKNLFFGWFVPHDEYGESLYAAAAYGVGFNPRLSGVLSRLTGLDVNVQGVLELRRLCRLEPRIDALPLSAFLSRCHKLLRREGYQYILSYSDPEQGHTGGVYVAAGFVHLGKTAPQYYVIDQKGKVSHHRSYQHYAKRMGWSLARARAELGLATLKMPPKDRWFLAL